MEDVRDPSALLRDDSSDPAEKNPEGAVLPVGDGKPNSAISVSVSTGDSRSLDMAEEGIDGSSPRGALEDCPRSVDSETAFKDCSSSVESETASSKASTSDSEAQLNLKVDFHWRPGFLRVLKRSPDQRVLEDCPSSVESETASKDCSTSVESETASKTSTSDSEAQSNLKADFQWPRFLRVLKKSSDQKVLEDCPSSVESETASKDCSSSVESDTASSKGSTSDSEAQSNSKADFQWPGFFRVLKKSSAKRFQTLPPLGVPKIPRRRKNKSMGENVEPTLNSSLDAEFYCFKSSWKNFTLTELQAATNNFCPENLIGEGGYAEVYEGILEDGQHVAIKRLTRGSPEEMTADFLSELGIIVHVDHPNTAKLVGYGVEGGMHLVLHLSPHGSLASLLQGSKEKLEWGIRYKIALGTAEGLSYLHEGCQRRIIHRDIKASNVLLTEDFDPQISDFGLAKWLPEQCSHLTVSKFEGTFGYLPPEFFMHGIVDEKTDVFAYGVLLLELITGRLALDDSQRSLVMWAKPLLEKNNIRELVDPSLGDAYDIEQMNLLVSTASLCISQCSIRRPQMSQVVQILRGDEGSLELAKQCQKSGLQRAHSGELFEAEGCNSIGYLSDLNQQMQITLGL